MSFGSLFTILGLFNATSFDVDNVIAYRVNIQPIIPNVTVNGFVTLYTEPSESMIGYAGIISNLQRNLMASSSVCTNATNGCAVQIRSGTSCNSTRTIGNPYYNTTALIINPWMGNERYSTDMDGKANFQSVLNIGSIDIENRVFTVHFRNGRAAGCGIIEKVPIGEKNLLTTSTTNLTSSRVTSEVLVHTIEPDIACYFGMAKRLEPNLISYLNQNTSLMGMNCNFTNGCGVHIHNGTSCTNTTTQGGHYYNKTTVPIDPWLYTMYHATDRFGNAYFTGCAETGISDFVNRPFVVHSNNGSRVSCGLLKGQSTDFFVVIDSVAQEQISELESVLDYATFPGTNVNFEAKFLNSYRSVRVQFDNPERRFCVRQAPFLIFGQDGKKIPVGPHRMQATPFRSADCTGRSGQTLVKTFNVSGCGIRYLGRTVVNETRIFTLDHYGINQTVPSLSTYGALNLEARIRCGFRVDQVRFRYQKNNRNIRRTTDDVSPFYVFGNGRPNDIGPGLSIGSGNYSINIVIDGIDHGALNFTALD